jgi:hypothetical protein
MCPNMLWNRIQLEERKYTRPHLHKFVSCLVDVSPGRTSRLGRLVGVETRNFVKFMIS